MSDALVDENSLTSGLIFRCKRGAIVSMPAVDRSGAFDALNHVSPLINHGEAAPIESFALKVGTEMEQAGLDRPPSVVPLSLLDR